MIKFLLDYKEEHRFQAACFGPDTTGEKTLHLQGLAGVLNQKGISQHRIQGSIE